MYNKETTMVSKKMSSIVYNSPQFFKIFVPDLCSQQLRIPPVFLKNFSGYLPHKAILKSPTERSWVVEVNKVNENLFFQEGWQEFVHDHSLQFGDILIFSYAGKSKFYVEIYGENSCKKLVGLAKNDDKSLVLYKGNQANGPMYSKELTCLGISTMSIEENNGVLQADNKSVSINPSFTITLGTIYIKRGYLIIPSMFRHKYMEKERTSITLQLSGKSWPVKLLAINNRLYFSKGWGRFVKDNNLKGGDVCHFELLGRNNYVLKVSVSRSEANFDSELRVDKEKEKKMVKRRGRPRVFFFDDCPEFFKVYFPNRSSQEMCIPPDFIKHFNGSIPDMAILKDLGGKCWHVDMEEAENGVFFKSGWQRFVSDHSLKLGYFLFFRYNGTSSFTVRIFRTSGCKSEEPLAVENIFTRVKIEEETEEDRSKCTCTGKRKYSKQEIEEQICPKRSCVSKQKCSRIEIEEDRTCSERTLSHMLKCSKLGMRRPRKSIGAGEVHLLKSPRISAKCVENQKGFEATWFVTPKNPHFIAALTNSRRSQLNIPKQLVRQLNLERFQEMVLHNHHNGKKWPVKLRCRNYGRLLFSRGWNVFGKENNLRLDDMCLFEFVIVNGRVRKEVEVQILHQGTKNPTSL